MPWITTGGGTLQLDRFMLQVLEAEQLLMSSKLNLSGILFTADYVQFKIVQSTRKWVIITYTQKAQIFIYLFQGIGNASLNRK